MNATVTLPKTHGARGIVMLRNRVVRAEFGNSGALVPGSRVRAWVRVSGARGSSASASTVSSRWTR